MTDLELLSADAADKLAGLVFELASQLHEERARRQALETVLAADGLDLGRIDALVDSAGFRARSRDGADASIRRLLRILEENGDPEGPLRAEAPADAA